ncbi:hypothetical protein AB0O91_21165 [Kitasatospora sp. NPDC089797]|uniref:hypothetical protein n=1 Tax=Kitasatospora sp. NPDC089797 TaxID=3155298 RepID=UPI00341A7F51
MSTLTAAAWNDRYPAGTPVTAYPGVRPEHPAGEFCTVLETRTRSAAWTLGHGEPVVAVDGYAGGISLEHIDLREEPAPTAGIVHAGTDTAHTLVQTATEENAR